MATHFTEAHWWAWPRERFKLAPPLQTHPCILRAAKLRPMDPSKHHLWLGKLSIVILSLNPSWRVLLFSSLGVLGASGSMCASCRKTCEAWIIKVKPLCRTWKRSSVICSDWRAKFFREGQAWHSLWDQTWSDSCGANEAFGTLWLFIIISRSIWFSARWLNVHHIPAGWGYRFILAVAFQRLSCERNNSIQLFFTYSRRSVLQQRNSTTELWDKTLSNMESRSRTLWTAGFRSAHHVKRSHSSA